ncbi:MAG: ATP synthase F1 subunit delta [Candidatus Magasanikbacteria bacterium CG10_big_fil_rev_8_21_14_0_10_47_10]|uniref:ATP synthase F1 subunit delta n=1 Tax=Candidatus Magasanikbacteria bacterium CG10_big_fil_rev_8_21_14_0_10_47_10 TaxID=1974652 RepID=A0A2H0TQH2_9BACT|nr:MAG: ATP synthase F1 subunit delta [Candidatus Magasanikbacteria bacterium CG10_big_fil_rev_8_21_14_0_10_47_10]
MPKLIPIQYAKILYHLTAECDDRNIDAAVDRFMRYLRENQALSKLDYILDAFVTYAKERQGIVSLRITSARELRPAFIEQMARRVSDKAETEVAVDPLLIGGLVIQHGNSIIDASVKHQLDKLRRAL